MYLYLLIRSVNISVFFLFLEIILFTVDKYNLKLSNSTSKLLISKKTLEFTSITPITKNYRMLTLWIGRIISGWKWFHSIGLRWFIWGGHAWWCRLVETSSAAHRKMIFICLIFAALLIQIQGGLIFYNATKGGADFLDEKIVKYSSVSK